MIEQLSQDLRQGAMLDVLRVLTVISNADRQYSHQRQEIARGALKPHFDVPQISQHSYQDVNHTEDGEEYTIQFSPLPA